jgi:hypothetical protein
MIRHAARKRLQFALVAIVGLLFQQAALAAYLCPIEAMPTEMSAMADHCAEMGMEQARDNPALCTKHCNPDHTTVTDASRLSVPPLALPAPVFASIQLQAAACVVVQTEVPVARSDPPPRLRYCSLLI